MLVTIIATLTNFVSSMISFFGLGTGYVTTEIGNAVNVGIMSLLYFALLLLRVFGFSNVYNLRKVIQACRGSIFWIDKHFRKEGLEILLDGLPFEGVSSVTIISGSDNVTQSAKLDYAALKSELSTRSIQLSWRVITDNGFKWHDRWLLADNQCYNIPPVLAIIRGQRADILQTKMALDTTPFLEASTPIAEV